MSKKNGEIDPGLSVDDGLVSKVDKMASRPIRVGEQFQVSSAKAEAVASQIDLRRKQSPAGFLGNNTLLDSTEFGKITGIEPGPNEILEMNEAVQAAKSRIGLDHEVEFATDCDFCGYTRFAFIGTFKAWDRPGQKILVGLGILAKTTKELECFGSVLPSFQTVAQDFVDLSLEEKIEAVLVHEKVELEAAKQNQADPHRYAVAHAPNTKMKISPRTRDHLRLYARADKAHMGEQI